MKYKAFLFDVDGTITRSAQQITNEMARILSNLPGEIGFVSGTNVDELKRMISTKLNRKHHILGNTGTHYVIIDKFEKEIVKEFLSKDQKEEIISALKVLKEEYSLIPQTNEKDQIIDRNSQITFSILGRNAPLEDKEGYDIDRKKREGFVEYLKNIIGDEIYEIRIGGTTSIDVTLKGKTKDSAIKLFSKINNISPKDILFFGDQLKLGGNDFEATKSGAICREVKNPDETLEILKSGIF